MAEDPSFLVYKVQYGGDARTRADAPDATSTALDFAEWLTVVVDAKMTTALLNRLTDHRHIVKTGNDSHYSRNSKRVAGKRIKARE